MALSFFVNSLDNMDSLVPDTGYKGMMAVDDCRGGEGGKLGEGGYKQGTQFLAPSREVFLKNGREHKSHKQLPMKISTQDQLNVYTL